MSPPPPLLDAANVRLKACKHGAMMYHPNDEFIGRSLDLYGEFCEAEMALFAQLLQPGMTIVDAGANIGTHTLYFAKVMGPSGTVHAFEPQPVLYQMLCGNIARNGHTNVIARNAALGRERSEILAPRIDYARGGNFGGVALGEWRKGETIPLVPLADCGLTTCHFIKIDVEGMELAVLEGASAVLDRHRPLLYVENDREEKSGALIEWLLARDYRLYWHLPPLFSPDNHFGESRNVFGGLISINMLCVPRSKEIAIKGLREITSPTGRWQV